MERRRRRRYDNGTREALTRWLAPREGELILLATHAKPLTLLARRATAALGCDVSANMIGRQITGLHQRGTWRVWRGEYVGPPKEEITALLADEWPALVAAVRQLYQRLGVDETMFQVRWSDTAVALALQCAEGRRARPLRPNLIHVARELGRARAAPYWGHVEIESQTRADRTHTGAVLG